MLKYVGDGGFIPGIPARDIGKAELLAMSAGWAVLLGVSPKQVEKALIKSGLYEKVKEKRGGE